MGQGDLVFVGQGDLAVLGQGDAVRVRVSVGGIRGAMAAAADSAHQRLSGEREGKGQEGAEVNGENEKKAEIGQDPIVRVGGP